MATRTISTRILLEGEKEYRSQIKQLNSEMKTLKSELKAVDSEMKLEGKSVENLARQEKTLNDAINKQQQILSAEKAALEKAQAAQAQFAEAAEKARQKLDKLQNETDENTRETEEYKRALAEAKAEVEKYENAEQRAAQAVETHKQKLNEGEAQLNGYQGQLEDTEDAEEEFNEEMDDTFKSMTSVGAVIGTTVVAVKKLADVMVDCVNSAMEWETAFTGVKKTVDTTAEGYLQLSADIRKMATELPYAATEIAKVAEISGQLGVSADDVLEFSKVMLDLGISTNMSAEEAATALARFANITGMAVEDVDRLASVVVDLGNNFATTESEIVDMASNIAAVGTQVGLTEPEIMALATALSSLGLEAASGGSSISKMMKDMSIAVETASPRLKEFADVAGMTAEEFQQLWREDSMAALTKFFGGLSSGSDSATKKLADLGITNVRTSDTALRLSNAVQILEEATVRGTAAWDDNTALTIEAGKQYDTLASRLEVAKNKLEETKIEVGEGLTPAVIGLESAWEAFLPSLLNAVPQYKALKEMGDLYVESATKEAEIKENQIKWESEYQKALDGTGKALDETASKTEQTAQRTASAMRLMEEAYSEAFESAYNDISKTVEGFANLDFKVEGSTKDLIENLKSQQKYMNDYAENIRTAAEWGIDKGFLATLTDGSMKSAEILAQIVEGGMESVDEFNAELRRTEEGKIDFANTLAEMEGYVDTSGSNMVAIVGQKVREMNAEFNQLSTYSAMQQIAALQETINSVDWSNLKNYDGGFSFSSGSAHAAGLDYVPYDEYPANLHKGEMVLTALEAKAYRAERTMENVVNNSTINIGDINVSMGSDTATAKQAGRAIYQELQTQLRQRGVRF